MRTLIAAAMLLGALCMTGCEDDPEDLDYLKQQDAGSEGPAEEDPGSGDGDGDSADEDAGGSDNASAEDAGNEDAS